MVKPREIRKGDMVRVIGIPTNLRDRSGIGTPLVFESALGKTFRVEGIGEYGHLELVVSPFGYDLDRARVRRSCGQYTANHLTQSIELTAICCEVYVSRG